MINRSASASAAGSFSGSVPPARAIVGRPPPPPPTTGYGVDPYGTSQYGSPTSPDTTPPVISSVAAGSLAPTEATVTWTTDEGSDSQVEYGTTTAYGSSSSLNSSLVTAHSVPLGSLTASTVYHYRVKSRDSAGNLATSSYFTFTTSAPPPTSGYGVLAYGNAGYGS